VSGRGLGPARGDDAPGLFGDQRVQRLLALFERREGDALPVSSLREEGIQAPAQAIYELQLAGYIVDRVAVRSLDGRVSFGYRLSGAPDGAWAERRVIGGDGR
jgi:hypothetical protein